MTWVYGVIADGDWTITGRQLKMFWNAVGTGRYELG